MIWRFSSTSPSFKNIQNLVMCDQFSFNKMTIFINIAPYKILDPCKRCFLLWKSPFSVASSPDEIHENFAIQNFLYPSKRCFPLWKSPFSVASPPDQNQKIRMLHFLCAAPASSATCQSDSISLNLAVWHTIIPSEFENPLTLATFTSIKELFSARSPPGILCVDKITMNKLPAQRENFLKIHAFFV